MTPPKHRTWLGVTGPLIVLLAFTLMNGVRGLLLGGLVAVGWWILPAVYAFVLGHFALLLVVAHSDGLAGIAGAELGLVVMICTATAKPAPPGRILIVAVGGVGGASILAWLGAHRLATVWGIGGLVLGGGAILAYWIHRYERVALGQPAATENSNNE